MWILLGGSFLCYWCYWCYWCYLCYWGWRDGSEGLKEIRALLSWLSLAIEVFIFTAAVVVVDPPVEVDPISRGEDGRAVASVGLEGPPLVVTGLVSLVDVLESGLVQRVALEMTLLVVFLGHQVLSVVVKHAVQHSVFLGARVVEVSHLPVQQFRESHGVDGRHPGLDASGKVVALVGEAEAAFATLIRVGRVDDHVDVPNAGFPQRPEKLVQVGALSQRDGVAEEQTLGPVDVVLALLEQGAESQPVEGDLARDQACSDLDAQLFGGDVLDGVGAVGTEAGVGVEVDLDRELGGGVGDQVSDGLAAGLHVLQRALLDVINALVVLRLDDVGQLARVAADLEGLQVDFGFDVVQVAVLFDVSGDTEKRAERESELGLEGLLLLVVVESDVEAVEQGGGFLVLSDDVVAA